MDDGIGNGIGNGWETRTNKEQKPKKIIQFNNSTEIRTYRPNKPMQPRTNKEGKNSISKIRLMNVNIRGTNSKTESLKSAIMTYKPEIVCL